MCSYWCNQVQQQFLPAWLYLYFAIFLFSRKIAFLEISLCLRHIYLHRPVFFSSLFFNPKKFWTVGLYKKKSRWGKNVNDILLFFMDRIINFLLAFFFLEYENWHEGRNKKNKRQTMLWLVQLFQLHCYVSYNEIWNNNSCRVYLLLYILLKRKYIYPYFFFSRFLKPC